MPFTGPDDPKLPDNWKKLPEGQRVKVVKTFNAAFENCRDSKTGGGAGSVEQCEGVAFKIANGTIKKEVEVMEDKQRRQGIPRDDIERAMNHFGISEEEAREGLESGKLKLPPRGSGKDVVAMDIPVAYKPFGGAQDFGELDAFMSAQEQRIEISDALRQTDALIANVMEDDDLEKKPSKLQKVVDGFRKRVAKLMGTKETEVEEINKQVTKTEGGIQFKASDYAVVPDPEKPSTWKLRLAEGRSGNFTVVQVARAITAMQPSGFRGQRVQLTAEQKKQAISRISAAIGKSDGNDDQKSNLRRRLNAVKDIRVVECPTDASHLLEAVGDGYRCRDCGEEFKEVPIKYTPLFMVTKDNDGNMRWIGIPSNKWRDRDNPPQIIEEAAHKEFTEYLDKTKDFPILLSWHTPGTRLGVADFADYSNGFLIMGGPIDREKYAEAAKLAEKCQQEDIGMSHGFVYTYSDKSREIIGQYRAWEVSHLPLDKAANVWTAIDILNKEVKQMFNPEKRKYIVDLHGEDTAVALENKVTDLEKDLVSAGIEFKDLGLPGEDAPQDAAAQVSFKDFVESDGFKAMITAITSLTDGVKELKETTIPALVKRLDDVESASKDIADKTKKTADDLIAEAFNSKSSAFQPSKDGKPPTEAEKKEEDITAVTAPVDEKMTAGFFGPPTPAQ